MASVVTVNNIINLLDEMAPLELAESWDNVGLMLADAISLYAGCFWRWI